MDTKEQILEAALELFSKRGYADSSIRDICKVVGIKESSLYYHFENKQAILEELEQRFIQKSERFMAMLQSGGTEGPGMIEDAFRNVGIEYAKQYLLDEFIVKIAGLMMIEQAVNTSIRALYEQWFFEQPLAFQSGIFQVLLECGYLRGGEPAELAMAYYAPIFFQYARYLLDRSAASRNVFLAGIQRHMDTFLKTYGGGV